MIIVLCMHRHGSAARLHHRPGGCKKKSSWRFPANSRDDMSCLVPCGCKNLSLKPPSLSSLSPFLCLSLLPSQAAGDPSQVWEGCCEQLALQPPLRTLLLRRGCVLTQGQLVCLAKFQSGWVFALPVPSKSCLLQELVTRDSPPAHRSPQAACF